MYKITLADGQILDNLQLNGNNFISDIIIEDSVFIDNLHRITIEHGDSVEIRTDMTLVQNQITDGKSWFILTEMSPQDKALVALKAVIDSNEVNLTDVQLALAEVYELISGGL